MAHGFGGTIEHDLRPYAERFAANGFAVLLHDHRGWGASGGEPRQDIDPWRQVADWRRAITFLADRPEVDQDRIGLWGTSYAGGHALVLGATERRIRAVVAQVPTISGYEQGLRRVPPDRTAALEAAFDADERDNFHGEPLRRQAIVSADPDVPASYHLPAAVGFYLREHPDQVWRNEITLRSNRAARMYEPGAWVSRVSPTPLLMIVATHDTVTVTDLALAAYERALEPKRLVLVPGGHFDPYVGEFETSASAALAWFREHLKEAT
jgi:fermentation-respiration switch protein FrsA (DUF1100 family)